MDGNIKSDTSSELEYKNIHGRIACTPDFQTDSILITHETDGIEFVVIQMKDVYTFLNIFMRAVGVNVALQSMLDNMHEA